MSRATYVFGLCLLLRLTFVTDSLATEGGDGVAAAEFTNSDNTKMRIAFGSCRNQSAPQPIWDAIRSLDPQVFVWLGDNIYADVKQPLHLFGSKANAGLFAKEPHFLPVSVGELKAKYDEGKADPGYQALRSKTKVIGTWDDHDYGLDDSGKELKMKRESLQLMLDFLDEPHDSPRRRQNGVYTSYTFGSPGKRVKVILLDTRFNRDPHFSDGTILGSEQWKWFENELRNTDSQIHIIGSSIQVVSNLSALLRPMVRVEGWARFPSEQQRLFDLIASSKAPGVVFISGDVHFTEINRFDCSASGYPLYDVTSSGLTQAAEIKGNFMLTVLQRTVAFLMASPMRVRGQPGIYGCRYLACVYGLPNFGLLEIDWDARSIDLQTRDVEGRVVLGRRVAFDELLPGALSNPAPDVKGKFQKFCTREVDLPWLSRYRLAILIFSLFAVIVLIPIIMACFLAQSFIWLLRAKRKFE